MSIAPKIVRLVNSAQYIEQAIRMVDESLEFLYKSHRRTVLLNKEEVVYRNPITAINLLLARLRTFFSLVKECFEEEEDRNSFRLYRDWYGVNTSPIPYPSHLTEFPWPFVEVDVVMITPWIIDLIRKHVESVNAS